MLRKCSRDQKRCVTSVPFAPRLPVLRRTHNPSWINRPNSRGVETAAANPKAGVTIMETLLRERGEIRITERFLLAAAKNLRCGVDIVEFLLRTRADEVRLTERLLKAAAGRDLVNSDMLKLLLSQKGDVWISTKMVETAVLQELGGKQLVEMLLQAGRHDIQLTRKLVAEGNNFHLDESLKTIVEQCQPLRVGKGAALALAKLHNRSLLGMLVRKLGHDEKIREAARTGLDKVRRRGEVVAVACQLYYPSY